jgi:hypothetical protein
VSVEGRDTCLSLICHSSSPAIVQSRQGNSVPGDPSPV